MSKIHRIPIFPIGLVAFPGEPTNLHIYEEKYKNLVAFCLEGEAEGSSKLFGIFTAVENKVEEFGCAVYIQKVTTRYPDGRMDLLCVGFKRCRISKIYTGNSFSEADVTFFDDENSECPPQLREQAITLHMKLVELVKGKIPHIADFDSNTLSYYLSNHAGLDLPEKIELLKMRSEGSRIEYLIEYYQRVIPVVIEREEIKERVLLNGSIRKLKSIELK